MYFSSLARVKSAVATTIEVDARKAASLRPQIAPGRQGGPPDCPARSHIAHP